MQTLIQPWREWEVPHGSHVLHGYSLSPDHAPTQQCLILHGAGKANKERVRPLAIRLATDFAVHAFDAVGHGQTGGSLEETTLRDRSRQAQSVLGCVPKLPLVLVGVSMGGYTALDLVLRSGVNASAVVLLAGAVYADAAYEVPFGAGFTQILRQPRSWEASSLWPLLERYTGTIHVITGSDDDVIPSEIPERIATAAALSGCSSFTRLDGVPHQISGLMSANPTFAQQISDLVLGKLRSQR